MKKLIKTGLMLSLFLLAFVSKSFAQQWSAEQKDVWASEIKNWNDFQSGNFDAFMSYFDDSSMDWDFQTNAPQTKADMGKVEGEFLKNNSVIYTTLTPITIWVKGDYAYTQYFYTILTKNKVTGKEDQSEGNWTDILMKQNGKWLLVGDRGGRTSKPSSN